MVKILSEELTLSMAASGSGRWGAVIRGCGVKSLHEIFPLKKYPETISRVMTFVLNYTDDFLLSCPTALFLTVTFL